MDRVNVGAGILVITEHVEVLVVSETGIVSGEVAMKERKRLGCVMMT